MKTYKIVLIISVLAFSFSACQKKEKRDVHHDDHHETQTVQLKKELQVSEGITVIEAKKQKMVSFIEVFGSIAQDTQNTCHITSAKPGILRGFIAKVGDTVEKNSPIAKIDVQGVVEEIICPMHGIVIAQYVKEGEKVDNLTSIATVANPDLLRASFDLYEKDLGLVREGQDVLIATVAYPDRKFSGKVVFISPRVDDVTRTIKIGVDVENKEHLLKFGMAVTGKIVKESEQESLVVPLESIQQLDDSWAVFIQTEDEKFVVREVKKGTESGNQVEILEGLTEGEKVVATGSFLLKSELMKEQLGGHDD